jgi:hypothetical protein
MEVGQVEGRLPHAGWDKPSRDDIFQAGKGPEGLSTGKGARIGEVLRRTGKITIASYNYDTKCLII